MYTIGQEVKIQGFGSINGKQFRGTVTRLTKTLVTVTSKSGATYKFRVSDGREPGTEMSGWKIAND
jgi:hypothetical protein